MELDDATILNRIQGFSGQCVACDFRYHQSCLTEYMNKSPNYSQEIGDDAGLQWMISYIDNTLSFVSIEISIGAG